LGPKAKLYAEEIGETNPGSSGGGLPEIESLWWEGNPWKGHIELDDRQGPVAVGRVSKLDESDHFDGFVARESIRFLKDFGKQDKPFFLISSFLKPHDPFMPAARFTDMFRPDDMKLPKSWGKANLATLPAEVRNSIESPPATPELRDPAEAKKRMAFYYANLAEMDDCVGQVLKALEELDLDRDTIVCYTSDHGEMLGELGLWQKFQFYEGSCGVPLMIRIPGQPDGVNRAPVSLVSLSATITDLCGVKQLTPNDGVTFAELVRNPAVSRSQGPVFAEYSQFNRNAKYMVRDRNLKYSYRTNDKPELYDLVNDPEELQNLAGLSAHASDEARLRQQLFEWHSPQHS
jgi:choline-sulfatase